MIAEQTVLTYVSALTFEESLDPPHPTHNDEDEHRSPALT